MSVADTIDEGFGHWLAGFADGEGCFWVHRQKGGAYYAPQFKIKLRRDDRDALVLCQTTLGIGNLYDHPGSVTSVRNNAPSSSWMVQSRADTETLVEVFDRFPLRAKKARDYALWRLAVHVRAEVPRGNRWHGPKNWEPLLAVKAQLENVRRYTGGAT